MTKRIKDSKLYGNTASIWILTFILDLLAIAIIFAGIKDHAPIWAIALLVILIEFGSWGSKIALAPAGFWRKSK